MAGTITVNTHHNTSYKIAAAQHYGLMLETGVYTPSTGTTQYTTAGDSITFASGFTPMAVIFSHPFTSGLSTAGLHYVYDPDNASVHWMQVGIELTTTAGATVEGLTANYVAIGWGAGQ